MILFLNTFGFPGIDLRQKYVNIVADAQLVEMPAALATAQ